MHRTLVTSAKALSVIMLFAFLVPETMAFRPSPSSIGHSAAKANLSDDNQYLKITKRMVVTLDKQNTPAPADSDQAKRLAALAKDHLDEAGLKLNFKSYLQGDVEAFSTPDGSVRFFAGLMNKMTDDELRFIIGREIGHALLGHSMERARTAYKSLVGTAGAFGQKGIDNSLGNRYRVTRYPYDQEGIADGYAVDFLKRHNYNLAAAESAMRKLAEMNDPENGGGGVSSHYTGSVHRADMIHKLITN